MKIPFALRLVLLGLAGLGSITAQEMDWVHAPLNPVGQGYQRAHFNLKGPLYATGRQIFDREGRLLAEESRIRYEDGLPVGQAGAKWETDAAGRVTKVTYPNRSFIEYTYEGGRLVEELESRQEVETRKRYRYDGRGRVDQITRISRNGEEVETLSYSEEGGRLIVRQSTQRGNEAPRHRTQHYLDGYLVFAQGEGDPISLTVHYEFDAWGNPTTIRHEQNNGVVDTFTRSYHYYPDLEARNELTFGAINPENPRSSLLPYRNGRQAPDIEVRLVEGKGHLLYDPFSNSYYLAEPVPEADRGTRRTPRLIAPDTEVITLSQGTQLFPYVRGRPVFVNASNRLVSLPQGDWLLYSEGGPMGRGDRYSLWIQQEPGAEWFPGEILRETYGLFDSHKFYTINATGNIDLISSGNKLSGPFKEARTGEMDLVLIEQGRPLYVLPGALKPPPPGIYEARYFSASTDQVEPIRKAADDPRGLTPEEIATLIAAASAQQGGYEQAFVHPILAPLNPVPHISSLWDANLEDGVAATRIDFVMYYFNERGRRIYPTGDYFTDEAAARAQQGVYLLFNQSGRLLLSRDYLGSEKTTVYTWNENGTVARRQVIHGDKVFAADSYVYDEKRRLIEHIQHRERNDHRVSYRYREAGGQLIVEEQVQRPASTAELVYEAGRLVRRTLLPAAEHTPWTATYTFDEMGNPLQREGSDGVIVPFPTYYHSETWHPEAWTWSAVESGGAHYPELFVNGRFFIALGGAYTETYPYPDAVHYEPIRQNYLLARGALLPESKRAGAGGPMDVVAGKNLVQIVPGGKFRIFLTGMNTSMSKGILLGESIVLYDGRTRHSYFLPSVDVEKPGDYIPEDLGPDAALIYQDALDGSLTLLLNGEAPPLDEFSYGGTYANGDRLMLLRGEPWRVMAAAHLDQVGRAYPLLDAKGRGLPPTAAAAAPAPAAPKPAPVPYRKWDHLTAKRSAEGFEFLQKDEPVVAPAAFYLTPTGNGLAFYSDGFYLSFPRLGELAEGRTQVSDAVTASEYFAEVIGEGLTLWRSGRIVPAESYASFLCEDGRRLVHVAKPSRSLLLDVTETPGGFSPVRKWGPNSLIKNANGVQCIQRGQVLEGAVLHSVDGNLVVYVETDPYFVLEGFASIDEVPVGIHELKDFSY